MTDVVDERHLAAPPDVVWRALTSAEELERWFWPEQLATTAQADVRVGGRYRIASPVAEMAVSGAYATVRPGELLEFGWQWDGEELASTVVIELTAAAESGTVLTVTHSGLAASELDSHIQGWSDCLDRLPGHVTATGQAG